MTRQWTCFDVFAGCGGLSLGLSMAGVQVVAACESDKFAADTYAFNHPNVELHRTDIRKLSSSFLRRRYRGEIDLLTGGPPCQGFSVSGKRQYGIFLPGNALIHEFIRLVEVVRPRVFLLENVRGFSTAKLNGYQRALDVLLHELTKVGYDISFDILQAADFGLPQYRQRLFIVGTTWNQEHRPFPSPSRKAGAAGRWGHRGCLEAIFDLPQIRAREGSDGPVPYDRGARNAFQRDLRRNSTQVYNHQAMKHTNRLVERFQMIPPGGSGYKLGRQREFSNVEKVTVYKSNNQRLFSELPSLCITANFQSNYIHPTLDRNLTAREAARLQSFPDTFIFKGRRTLMSSTLLAADGRKAENYLSQYNQIGNAVPPMLARQIAESIMDNEGKSGATLSALPKRSQKGIQKTLKFS